MKEVWILLGLLLFLGGLYFISYYLNSKTDIPEGIEPADCDSCNSKTCSVRGLKDDLDKLKCELQQEKDENKK